MKSLENYEYECMGETKMKSDQTERVVRGLRKEKGGDLDTHNTSPRMLNI
jgi:hypothetical protein